jgi:hypothetical protein
MVCLLPIVDTKVYCVSNNGVRRGAVMRSESLDGVWSKTAEESSPWRRLLAAVRRDNSRRVHRSSYVAVGALAPVEQPAQVDARLTI